MAAGKRVDIKSSKDFGEANRIGSAGDPDIWHLVSKAWQKRHDNDNPLWMKSTKAMNSPLGCWVQVTSEHFNRWGMVISCSESVTYSPNINWVPNPEPDDNGDLGSFVTVASL